MRDESVGSSRATESELLHSGHSHLTTARRSEDRRRTERHVQLMLLWMVMGVGRRNLRCDMLGDAVSGECAGAAG